MGRLCALQRAPGGRRAHPPCAAACARFKGRQTGRSRIPGALIINCKQHSVSLRMYIFHTQPLSRGLRLSQTPTQQQNATASFLGMFATSPSTGRWGRRYMNNFWISNACVFRSASRARDAGPAVPSVRSSVLPAASSALSAPQLCHKVRP